MASSAAPSLQRPRPAAAALAAVRLAPAAGRRRRVRACVAMPRAPNAPPATKAEIEGPSTDISVILTRLQRLVLPYWVECPSARWRLAGVVGLTLATTGVSVVFSFLGRDFYNALSERDAEGFRAQLAKYLVGFALGIPVFVYSDYLQVGQRQFSPSSDGGSSIRGGMFQGARGWRPAVGVTFNYLGRDFYNAISEKNVDAFQHQLVLYLAGFCVGIPVYVFKAYYQSCLALEWREWMTSRLLGQYFADRSFYQLQAGALVDNPDQRIAADVRQFTDAALGLSLTVLNSLIDLVSFSGILYSIYPPLFGALLAYSIGGTLGSIALGKSLVGLNFNQEAVEADMRYGLVRVRENAESIAFYGGQQSEMEALVERLRAVVANYSRLLVASRNLDFFTSFYRFLIQLLPAAVVAPLFFAGKIEFGVITQSSSAFNHILNDVSLVVYQFETLAGFSAVVDRLGEFQEVVDVKLRHTHPRVRRQRAAAASLAAAVASASAASSLESLDGPAAAAAAGAAPVAVPVGAAASSSSNGGGALGEDAASAAAAAVAASGPGGGIQIVRVVPWQEQQAPPRPPGEGEPLLELDRVSINTPDGGLALVQDLSLQVRAGQSLLVMGPSGAGKTSVLRALAGLWESGGGSIYSFGLPGLGDPGAGERGSGGGVLFLPQRPYMVLGSLRDQLLYPTWARRGGGGGSGSGSGEAAADGDGGNGGGGGGEAAAPARPVPSDEQLEAVLRQVQLGPLLQRCKAAAAAAAAAASASGSGDGGAPTGGDPAAAAAATTAPAGAGAGAGAGSAPAAHQGSLAEALDHVADWSGMLSLGEQQRLAFARLLLAAPRLALLDEATSALDTANEALLYKALLASGTTVISVGHRPTLISYHSRVLQLSAGKDGAPGCWQLLPAERLLVQGSQ